MVTPENAYTGETQVAKTHHKRVAILKHPLIEAVALGLLRFADKPQAMKRLNEIRNKFIIAKDQNTEHGSAKVKLWIKDYGLSDEDIKKGYRGHFGEIDIIRLESGKFSLKLIKLEVPVSAHPQKTRQKRSHPDWGHPILRRIEKAPIFTDLEKANELLMSLHEEYPNISIPGHNQLLIMIYRKGRGEPGTMPVQKFRFSIVLAEEDKYKIVYEENIRKPKIEIKKEEPETPKVNQGKFTAMVTLKKKKRK